ncbi:MAG: hypothetical protein OEM80_10125, partial [Desulfobulbaceae bacterium]|nr:hypothetical protein [Desulfobulbaceae bacterium]
TADPFLLFTTNFESCLIDILCQEGCFPADKWCWIWTDLYVFWHRRISISSKKVGKGMRLDTREGMGFPARNVLIQYF